MAPTVPMKNALKANAATLYHLVLIPATSAFVSSCDMARSPRPNLEWAIWYERYTAPVAERAIA
jgi:hypothetical protein